MQSSYRITCTIGKDKIEVHAVIDRRNNSIHLHVFGEIVGNKPLPILVKHSDREFKEGKDAELITQVLVDHFQSQAVQINSTTKLHDKKEFITPDGHSLRIIVRFKD